MTARLILLVTLLAAPWCYGGIYESSQAWLGSGVMIALLLAVPALWRKPAEESCDAPDGAVQGERPRQGPSFSLILLVLIAAVLWGTLQLVPLPKGVVRILSRNAVTLRNELLPSDDSPEGELAREFGVPTSNRYQTLSLRPAATRIDLTWLCLATATFLLASRLFATTRAAIWLCGLVGLNGAALALFGIVQQLTFNGQIFWIGLVPRGTPFASFGNRNNAAGYLNLCLAAGLGFTIWAANRNQRSPEELPDSAIQRRHRRRMAAKYRLTAFLADLDAWKLTAFALSAAIVAAVFCTLSRGGGISLLAAGAVAALSYAYARRGAGQAVWLIAAGIAGLGLVTWVGMVDLLEARFLTLTETEKLMGSGRVPNWTDALHAVPQFPVTGTGLSTYRDVYHQYQHRFDAAWYFHAENEYVQALVEAGIVGLALLLAAVVLVGWACLRVACPPPGPLPQAGGGGFPSLASSARQFGQAGGGGFPSQASSARQFRQAGGGGSPSQVSGARLGPQAGGSPSQRSGDWQFGADGTRDPHRFITLRALGQVGLFAIVGQAIHAGFDFGIYLPANALLMATLCGVVVARQPGNQAERSVWLTRASLLLLVEVGLWGLMDLFRAAEVNLALEETHFYQTPTGASRKQLDATVTRLTRLTSLRPDDAELWDELAKTRLQLFRLERLEQLRAATPADVELDSLWDDASARGYHKLIYAAALAGDDARLERLRSDPLVKKYLRPAVHDLMRARAAAPLLAKIHLRLAPLAVVVGPLASDTVHLQRACRVEPSSGYTRTRAGLLHAYAGRLADACRDWSEILALDHNQLREVLPWAREFLTDEQLGSEALPPDPEWLVTLSASEFRGEEDRKLRELLWKRSAQLVEEMELPPDLEAYLPGRILALRGQDTEAAPHYETAVFLRPDEPEWQYEFAIVLRALGRLDEAQQYAQAAARIEPKIAKYDKLLREVIREQVRGR